MVSNQPNTYRLWLRGHARLLRVVDTHGHHELHADDCANSRFGAQQAGSLKEQLQAALQAAEAQEKATEESLKPQSVVDVDMLEKKLNEVLDELNVRKSELQKKPAR